MKKYIIILSVALLAATSCADQLEQAPANAISTEQIKEILASGDSTKIDLIIGGIANNIPYAIHKTIGYNGTGADARVNSPLNLQYFNSLLGYDIVCNSTGSGMNFGYEAYIAHTSRRGAVNSSQNYPYWSFGWSCVVAANKLLFYMPEDVNSAKLQDYKARALTLRAFGYNFLMENYRGVYQSNGEGLMIYDKMGEGTYKGYSTAGETYDFIKKDLTEAVSLFAASKIGEKQDGYTADTRDIDLGVANFVLARVSLLTGDYATAISACNSVLAKYPNFIAKEYYGGQNTGTAGAPEFHAENNAFLVFANNPEVIFGFDNVEGSHNVASVWLNVFGVDYGGAGGNYGRIVSPLYDVINVGDVRKGVFLDGATSFFEYEYPSATPVKRTVPEYSNLKYAATHVGNVKSREALGKFDVCYMRSSEVLLVKAEAQAKNGDEAGAKATLNTLLAARSAGATTLTCDNYGMTGSALDMVKLQWRIEMWGENGSEYYNNKRWGNTIIRTTPIHWEDAIIDAEKMTLEIPADETLYNPNL